MLTRQQGLTKKDVSTTVEDEELMDLNFNLAQDQLDLEVDLSLTLA